MAKCDFVTEWISNIEYNVDTREDFPTVQSALTAKEKIKCLQSD